MPTTPNRTYRAVAAARVIGGSDWTANTCDHLAKFAWGEATEDPTCSLGSL